MIETSRSVLVAAKRKGKRKRVNVVVRTKTKIKYNKKNYCLYLHIFKFFILLLRKEILKMIMFYVPSHYMKFPSMVEIKFGIFS